MGRMTSHIWNGKKNMFQTTNQIFEPPHLVGGWATPLKNDGVKVSWDDEIPNIWKVIKFMFEITNHIYIYNYIHIYITTTETQILIPLNSHPHPHSCLKSPTSYDIELFGMSNRYRLTSHRKIHRYPPRLHQCRQNRTCSFVSGPDQWPTDPLIIANQPDTLQ